ncbi:MAG: DUF2851 family protein [Prolixibacteraceae bacterium]|nr:DUF2851 family protein [Prolixibacteraceae bacterium]
MNEKFLQFVWKNQLFSKTNMATVQGEPLSVISAGVQNTDAGPDFFNAKVKIGDTLWAGNIEVHQKSSDWFNHNHHLDGAYENVILHVVLENDREIEMSNGQALPSFELKIDRQVILNYQQLVNENIWPSCRFRIKKLDPFYLIKTFETVLFERLSEKTENIARLFKNNHNNWNETFYQVIARNFGFKTNALPFEMLVRSTPYVVISKHRDNLFQLEALLFGQSGLLNEQLIGDSYFLKLRDEYSFLCQKYKLKGMESHLWKFLRLRPANFPTIRIAQFASFIHQGGLSFSDWIHKKDIQGILNTFNISASEYWDVHYRFNHDATFRKKQMGIESRNNILTNSFSPFLFFYGKQNNKSAFVELSFEILKALPPEKNRITNRWKTMDIFAQNASESQALIQLSNKYCIPKKCIDCQIGNKLIAQ